MASLSPSFSLPKFSVPTRSTHLGFSPSVISLYDATPGERSRKQRSTAGLRAASQPQSSSRMESMKPWLTGSSMPWLTGSMLANLVLPSVAAAAALDMDGASALQEALHFVPLADLDPSVASLLTRILGPVFASLNFLFIIRIVMSWYPQLPVDKFPYVIAFAPTEPVLEPTRKLIPPVGGVDVSPVIWVALMSFLSEILLGQQGLLVLLSEQRG